MPANLTGPNQPAAANENGHVVIEVRMSPDVEARIVEKTGKQSVEIVHATAWDAVNAKYRAGKNFG